VDIEKRDMRIGGVRFPVNGSKRPTSGRGWLARLRGPEYAASVKCSTVRLGVVGAFVLAATFGGQSAAFGAQ
jgi:hypothetical protein